MKHAALLLMAMLLTACGNKSGDTQPVNIAPKARPVAACDKVEDSRRVRLYGDNGDEQHRDVGVYNCIKSNVQYVEFRWAQGWSAASYKYEYLATWQRGRELPEYLDANVNCQIQMCEKE